MEQDLFKVLPSEIIINILSRLPVRAVLTSKCVCKPWLHLLETDDFINSHSAKSVPSLVVFMHELTPEEDTSGCTIFDLEEEIDVDQSHECRYNPLTKFVFPHRALMVGSASGFLCLRKRDYVDVVYVCNPITLEYIEIRHPRGFDIRGTEERTYGFGRSEMTREHKVLRILHNRITHRGNVLRSNSITKIECDVYTLGTGSWRSVEVDALLDYGVNSLSFGAYVNGCLHWIVLDLDNTLLISCFDLETECFSTFVFPPPFHGRRANVGFLCVLKDSLCLCDAKSDDGIVIWLMKECGIKKSWSKEYVFAVSPDLDFNRYGDENVYPIKVFKDGDVLMLWVKYVVQFVFYYYSNKTKTIHRIGILNERDSFINPMLLTPSFVSLKSFGMEDVVSF